MFTEDQVRLVSLFADQAAIAVVNAPRWRGSSAAAPNWRVRRGLLAALSQVAAQIEQTYDPALVLEVLAQRFAPLA